MTREKPPAREGRSLRRRKIAFISALLFDFLLLNAAFVLSEYLHRGRVSLRPGYLTLLLAYEGIWAVSSLFSRKYDLRKRPASLQHGLRPFLRPIIYMAALLLLMIFLFKMFAYSRTVIILTFVAYFSLVVIAYTLTYLRRWGPNVRIERDDVSSNGPQGPGATPDPPGIDRMERTVPESLEAAIPASLGPGSRPAVFLQETLRLESIRASRALLLMTAASESLQALFEDNWEFIGNLGRLNAFPRINRYFISVNEKLAPGGYFFGVGETHRQRLRRKFRGVPRFLAHTLYTLDFLWCRILPKIAGLNKLYFALGGRKERVLSQQEIHGRLMFCGFRDIRFREIDNLLYFVARKSRPPVRDEQPSYGFVFRQQRVGRNGEPVFMFKFRTMYPYSEYLHAAVLGQIALNRIGKIEDDPRITGWGRILRRYWIDELPMLVNYLRGELKLVGLRPITKSFLEIYPAVLRRERLRHKPAVLPAFYADAPKSIQEIFASEERYIRRFRTHPVRTDFAYFFRILSGIVFRRIRSS
jgi:hypothetical protein